MSVRLMREYQIIKIRSKYTLFSRPTLRYSLHGIKHLTKYLEQCCTVQGLDRLDANTAELCCETLKIIFNLLLSNEKPIGLPNEDEEDLQLQRDLMKIIRQFLLATNSNALNKKEELKRSKQILPDFIYFNFLIFLSLFILTVMP